MKISHLNNFTVVLTIFIAGLLLIRCGSTDDDLEPLPPPSQQPGSLVGPYYLDTDSTIALNPDFRYRQTGATSNNNFTMIAELELQVSNASNDTLVVSPGKITVYTISGGSFINIGTAELVPVLLEETTQEETIDPGSSKRLYYESNPIDELVYRPQDTDFFGVFTIIYDSNEQIFVSNRTS